MPVVTPDSFITLQDRVMEIGQFGARYRTLIQTWLNEGLHRLVRKTDLQGARDTQDITLAPGTVAYPLDADVADIISARIVYSDHAEEIGPVEPQAFDAAGTVVGTPTAYMISGQNIHFTPTPTQALTVQLRFFRDATSFSDDNETLTALGFPELEVYSDVLVSYALSRGYASEDDPDMAAYWRGEWERGVAEVRNDLMFDNRQGVKQVPGPQYGTAGPFFHRPY